MNGGHKNELYNLAEFLPMINPKTKTTLLGLNGYLGLVNNDASEQNMREFNCEQPLMGSSRWNPTPEQLLALEEMYRRGIRTPTAEQIQQIAAQLSRFGKIEGKNVFYWFQNHKARERQKRRREIEIGCKVRKHDHTLPSLDTKDYSSGLRRTVYEVEQIKTLIHPSSCSECYLEGPVSMHRAAVRAESTITTHGWSKFEEKELYQYNNNNIKNKNFSQKKKNATWHAMGWYPINNMTTTRSSRLFQRQSSRFLNLGDHKMNGYHDDEEEEEYKHEEVETLELFPLCSSEDLKGSKKDTKVPIKAINTKMSPKQYFEFLPLKN
ncbi:hypothetical protein JCGZ_04708 [Jatropha curcas]|uniref:Homeobox domain-containing protein n=1 Tax=Jatropha curcas TaxID=180498 RepID=A0A067L0P6_JATCU|nr:hypothetical protein JCGZ_04708 [Jatropha curcas]